MEIQNIRDTDLVHLLKEKLMIVLLYLDETFVRERNNLFLHHLPREMSIPEHYHMKCTSPAKNGDGFLPRVMINTTKYYRTCLIPLRGKENIFENCSTRKIKALCTLLTWRLQAVNPCTAPVSRASGYPHTIKENHTFHTSVCP